MSETFQLSYRVPVTPGAQVLAPAGFDTPHATCQAVLVSGGTERAVTEATTGQTAFLIEANGPELSLTWTFRSGAGPAYPDGLFQPHPSRFTRFADEIVAETAEIAPRAAQADRAIAIARATAERFTYGHPEARFNDGHEVIPALGCGIVEGSCVDINTYFIAALRAAGIEAGYVTGVFFPEEKQGTAEDGHCWVVTRIDGICQEWDIAHHLKMGTRAVAPGLNPKPGFRAALFHSMGLDFPECGVRQEKALIEPRLVAGTALDRFEAPEIRLHHPGWSVAAQ